MVTKPIKTTAYVWSGGWYYVRAGAGVSNQEIRQWSMEPIPGQKNLMLIGEAYWATRPGWSIGAYRSVDAVLSARFGELR